MVDRVLIQVGDQGEMRVSLPGADVNTANIDQTCFDSRWSGLIPYFTGAVDIFGGAGQGSASMSFGETLDQPPIFMGWFNTTNGPGGAYFDGNGFTPTMVRGGGQDYWYYVNPTTTGCLFSLGGFNNTWGRFTFTLFKRPAG